MNKLDVVYINDRAPYDVAYDEDGAIVFRTDYGIDYSVSFDDATEVKGEKGLEYVAAIIQRNNPHLNEIISLFDADITMFNEMKP